MTEGASRAVGAVGARRSIVLSPALAVTFGLVALCVVLAILNPRFASPQNITNLLLQLSATSVIAMGAALVLLLGEIDLSLGSVSGFTASVMAVLLVYHQIPVVLAIGVGLVAGLLVGLLHGVLVAFLGVPSFVATLGGLMAWQGAQLFVLTGKGNININDPIIVGLTTSFVTPAAAAVGLVLVTLGLLASRIWLRKRQLAAGMQPYSWSTVLRPVLISAVGGSALVAVLSADRGVPLVFVIILMLATLLHYVLTRRRFGRHVYAVGSNHDAADRVGIRVSWVRVAVFGTSGLLAATGGLLAASRLQAVNQSSGSGDFLMLAIAAAVIGGVSLFGGVGGVWNALLGALMVGVIANGLDLLSIPSSVRFMVTGAVLVAAVSVDAISRRRNRALR